MYIFCYYVLFIVFLVNEYIYKSNGNMMLITGIKSSLIDISAVVYIWRSVITANLDLLSFIF